MSRLLRLSIAAAIGPAVFLLIGPRADSALEVGFLLALALGGLAIWSIAEASAAYSESVRRWDRVEHTDREVWIEWRRRLLIIAIPFSLGLIVFIALNRDPTGVAVVVVGSLLGVIIGWREIGSREEYLTRFRGRAATTRYNAAAAAGLGVLIFAVASEFGGRTLVGGLSIGLVSGASGIMLARLHVFKPRSW